MRRTYRTESEEDTLAFAKALAGRLQAGDSVLLKGELGAGKSVLARGIARSVGVSENMPSPSFTMLIPYMSGRFPVYHYDLYRLGSMEEFWDAGLDEFLGGNGLSLIEWPQTIGLDITPSLEVNISKGDLLTERLIQLVEKGVEIDEALLERWQIE